jgi:hypothetical protein
MTNEPRRAVKATVIAVAVQLAIIVMIPIQPLWVRATGAAVFLETAKIDPQSVFRGHYAILDYQVARDIVPVEMAADSKESGKPIYVTVTTERPGRFVAASLERPSLQDGEACLIGRVRGLTRVATSPGGANEALPESVVFPQIAQYFASAEEAHRVETVRGINLLAKVATSPSCNAQLVGLEPRD